MPSRMVCPRPRTRKGRTSRRSNRRSSRRSNRRSRGRCLKPGPIGRNPYLNFLRQFRKRNCGLSPVETIRAGAKAWRYLSKEERLGFIKEAFYAPKRRRQSRGRSSKRSTSRKTRHSSRRAIC